MSQRNSKIPRGIFILVAFTLTLAVSASALHSSNPHDGAVSDETLNEAPATNIPRIETRGENFTRNEGDTVSLPCDVRDLGPFVILWRKGVSSLLFAGTLRVFRDERFALSNTDLEIRTLSPSDTGEYVCQVSTNPPTEITHYLKVLSAETTTRTHHTSTGVRSGAHSSMSSSSFNLISGISLWIVIMCIRKVRERWM